MKLAFAVAALSNVLAAHPAGAAPSHVALAEGDCAALDGDALRELVELELGTLSLTDTAAEVQIVCSGDTATVSLEDAQGRAFPIESHVDFSRAGPGARERLVALAATELVAQAERAAEAEKTRAEGAQPDTPAPRAPKAPDGTHRNGGGTRTSNAAHRPRTELSLAAVATILGHPATVLAGGGFGARIGIAGPWSVAVDARLERGAVDTAPARVTWTVLSGSAAVMLGKRLGGARGDIGAGVRAARLVLEADAPRPDSGRQVSGASLGPLACARAAIDLATHVALVALLEGGYVTLPVRGTVDDGETVVTADGPWGALGLGIAAVF